LLFIFCANISYGETVSKTDLDAVKVVLFPLNKAVISSIVDTSVKKYNFKEGEIFFYPNLGALANFEDFTGQGIAEAFNGKSIPKLDLIYVLLLIFSFS
jgi:hypothetical protein